MTESESVLRNWIIEELLLLLVNHRGATANKKNHGRLPMLKGYLILSADPEYEKTKYTYVQYIYIFHIFFF